MGQCPDSIKRLIDRFNQQSDQVRSADYNETLIRIQFINPMFQELGWDIENQQGHALQYAEVVHEDRVKVAGQTKAPDYSFRVGGQRKFFLEAKKPAVDIKSNWEPAYQLRRYAWSAKLPVSLLTDFEELAIYDTRIRPREFDKPATARRDYIRYTDYPDRWDFLEGTFSKRAILQGEFDRYVESKKGRGAQPFDDAFLAEIEQWRKALASNLALRNDELSEPGLNYAVQKIIDRIIFLRIAEDRGTEQVGQLMALLNGDHVYQRLVTVFNRADERYNSGLFHFDREPGRDEPPDTLTRSLQIDDRTLKEIIKALYYPQSPYEFTMVSADILGSVYERFLGNVITLTPAHRAKIEQKPEVRKAGGVYYTPTYIVDYIVKNTVGALLESRIAGETPAVRAKLRILDPACGSGSFLIGAYQYLLDWHFQQYLAGDPAKLATGKTAVLRPTPTGEWALAISERKRILLAHIHGVDIDDQAVEVTKLNLLLKCLEGETSQSLGFEQRLFRERALPDLGSNIKCGNSLIGTDIIGTDAWAKMTEEERRRINPFDYERAFPEVFKGKDANRGFDAVIGNPPYRRERDYKALLNQVALTQFGRRYKSPRMDLWYYFVHRSLDLVRKNGLLSFITNAYWVSGTGAEKLIAEIGVHSLEEVFSLRKLKVFSDVSGQHMVFRIRKAPPSTTLIRDCGSNAKGDAQPVVVGSEPIAEQRLDQALVVRGGKVECSTGGVHVDVAALLSRATGRLADIGMVRQGIAENPSTINEKTNKKFGGKWQTGEGVFALTPHEVSNLDLPPEAETLLRPYHDLMDLGRYSIAAEPSRVLIYTTKGTCPDIAQFPTLRDHLARFKDIMLKRRETAKGSNSWWHLHWPRDEAIFIAPKIISVQMAIRPSFVLSLAPVYVPFSVNVVLFNDPAPDHLRFQLGCLNSRLLWCWFDVRAKKRGIGIEINGGVLENAPVLDFCEEDPRHRRLTSLVDSMLSLHKRLSAERVPQHRRQIEREIEATDRQIDALVYQLYGLTDEEIAIVESATAPSGGAAKRS